MNLSDCVKVIERFGGTKTRLGKDCLSYAIEDFVNSRGYCALPLVILQVWAKHLIAHEENNSPPSKCPVCNSDRVYSWGMIKEERGVKYTNMGKMVLLIKCNACGFTDTTARDYARSD